VTEDLHFGPLELVVSESINTTASSGSYITMNYRYTDQTLQLLNTYLETAALNKEIKSDDDEKEWKRLIKESILNYEPKIYFGSSIDCVSAHSFLSFMNCNQGRDINYARMNLNFEGVNWKQMISNSVRDHKPYE